MATRMAASHGRLNEIHPGIDNVEDYRERFLLYCEDNGVTGEGADSKKKAIFLTSVGSPTYTLLKNLVRPGKPQDKSLEELFTLLKNNYEPKVIVIAERFRFYKRQQKEGETIAVYVSELRRLAKNCQFGDQLSIDLRDQFVCELFQEPIQQKLLAESDLTLDKALQIAQAAEITRLETQTLRGETTHHTKHSTETAFAVKKTTTAGRSQSGCSPPGKVCYRCNESGHEPSKCKFKNHTCHYCKSKGHIIKAFRKKGVRANKTNTSGGRGKAKAQATHEIEEEVGIICSVSGKDGVKITLSVADTDLEMEVDTGATVTVIPKEVYNRHLSHVKFQPSAVKLQAYNGERLKVLGEAMVQIRYKGQQACDKLIVVDVKEKPAVLGRNWISHFQLDWSSLFRVGRRHEIDPSKEFPQLFAEGMGMLTGYEANITLTPESRPGHAQSHTPYR